MNALCPAEGLARPLANGVGGSSSGPLEQAGDARRLTGGGPSGQLPLSGQPGAWTPLSHLLFVGQLPPARPAMQWPWLLAVSLAMVLAAGLSRVSGGAALHSGGHRAEAQEQQSRSKRGTEDDEAREVQQYVPEEWAEYPRPIHPAGLQPTQALVATSPNPDKDGGSPGGRREPRGNLTGTPGQRLQIQNPLYPVTESSYSAYAIMLLALVLFAVGIVGNLSVMCIVWHSYYLKSAWNSILASLALWDFLVLFFCLPVVIFNEITKQRLLGDVSCRAVPFMEVSVCPALGLQSVRLSEVGHVGVRDPRGPELHLASPPIWARRQMRYWFPVALSETKASRGCRKVCGSPGGQPQPGLFRSRLEADLSPFLFTLSCPLPALTPLRLSTPEIAPSAMCLLFLPFLPLPLPCTHRVLTSEYPASLSSM